ncbi:MAG: cobalamin biosynthesis protein CbiG [Nitrospirae bacterium]|nr:MAG: cobalamin biosynthesis protein CbiG [Nitrospirota bacterium]
MNSDIAFFALTDEGKRLGEYLSLKMNGTLFLPKKMEDKNRGDGFITYYRGSLSELIGRVFNTYRAMVFIMALGIVNRVIAPYIESKYRDPAVVTIDESARYVISTLSGHEGGANELTYSISSITGADPVVTTATEANRIYTCGLGCRRGVETKEIIHAIESGCREISIEVNELRCISSAWLKKDEEGLIEASRILGLHLRFIPEWMFKYARHLCSNSAFVESKIGVYGVSEPCALLSGRNTTLILRKKSFGPVTVAIAEEELLDIKTQV